MSNLAWYKKQMANPNLDTQTYLKYERIVQDAERRQNGLNQQAQRRLAHQQPNTFQR
jgi:hypothetical protein